LYLLGRGHDPWYGQQPLVERIGLGGIVVDDFTVDLGARSLALMQTYADVPMSLADASLVALAEQRRELRIVIFDSDFRVYRTETGSRWCCSMAQAERGAAICAHCQQAMAGRRVRIVYLAR